MAATASTGSSCAPITESSLSRSASSEPGVAVKTTSFSVRLSDVRIWQSSVGLGEPPPLGGIGEPSVEDAASQPGVLGLHAHQGLGQRVLLERDAEIGDDLCESVEPVEDVTEDDFDQLVDVPFKGVFALPGPRARPPHRVAQAGCTCDALSFTGSDTRPGPATRPERAAR